MTEEQELTRLQQWGRSPTTWRFWVGLVLVGALVVAGFVAGIGWMAGNADDLRTELNDRYVEEIDLESVPRGGGGYRDQIVIDGVTRYDCSESDGVLDCSEDPQPTEE